jgi:hypothetical protein
MTISRSKRAERGNRMTTRRQSHDNQALKEGREGQRGAQSPKNPHRAEYIPDCLIVM